MWGLTSQEHDDVGRLVRRRRTYQPRKRSSSHGHHERLICLCLCVLTPRGRNDTAKAREIERLSLLFFLDTATKKCAEKVSQSGYFRVVLVCSMCVETDHASIQDWMSLEDSLEAARVRERRARTWRSYFVFEFVCFEPQAKQKQTKNTFLVLFVFLLQNLHLKCRSELRGVMVTGSA